jgi:uncharacterized membrane protein
MPRKSLSYRGALGFGWRVMAANFWFFVGVWVVSFFVPYFVSFFVSLPGQILVKVMGHFSERLNLAIFVLLPGVFATIIINVILEIGITKITLSFCDSKKPKFSTLFNARGCFWRYIGAGLLYILIIGGTYVACALPFALLTNVRSAPCFALSIGAVIFILVVILSIKFGLCCYFVIDKGLGPIKALKASSMATNGAKLSLFVFGILCVLISVLGTLCFLVGLFATVPIVMLAIAAVYRQLSEQTPELAELGIGDPSVKPGAGGVGGSTQPFAGMQPNPIIPSIQSIQSGPSIRPGGGVQPTQSVRAGESTRPAPGIQPEGKKKSSNSLLWRVVVLVVCVAIAAGIGYYFLARSKSKIAVSLKDAAISLKDAAVSSNKVALKGILYSEDNPSALIGETIVAEGDIIDGVKVVKINKDTVEFEKDGEKWTQRTK